MTVLVAVRLYQPRLYAHAIADFLIVLLIQTIQTVRST